MFNSKPTTQNNNNKNYYYNNKYYNNNKTKQNNKKKRNPTSFPMGRWGYRWMLMLMVMNDDDGLRGVLERLRKKAGRAEGDGVGCGLREGEEEVEMRWLRRGGWRRWGSCVEWEDVDEGQKEGAEREEEEEEELLM